MKNIGAIAALLGGLFLVAAVFRDDGDSPKPPPDKQDVLDIAYHVDRIGRVKILREMASMEFENDPAQAAWHNQQTDALRATAFEPYVDKLSDALVAGTVAEFAEELDRGE